MGSGVAANNCDGLAETILNTWKAQKGAIDINHPEWKGS